MRSALTQAGIAPALLSLAALLLPPSAVVRAEDGGASPATVSPAALSPEEAARIAEAERAAEQSVVITGTRTPRRSSEDPVGTERIGQRELAAHNVRDASRALEAEPGIQVERSFRGSSFQLRGLDAKYVRILVDGQPVVGQVNDVIDLRRYSVEAIERIEVVRGATSALYGSDALAGVVNLISRRPKRSFEGGAFVQYGSLNQSVAGLTVGGRRGSWAGMLTLNWFGNDSYDLTPGDQNLQTNGDARRVGVGSARLFYKPSTSFEALAWVRAGLFDSRGVDLQPPRALYNRIVGEQETAAGAQAVWRPDEATRITLLSQVNAFARAFWRQQRLGKDQAGATPEDQKSLETLARAEVQADRSFGKPLTVSLGLGTQHGAFDSPRLANGGASVNSGWLYLQAEGTSETWGDVVVGTRLDLDGQFGAHPSPRIAGRLKLNPILEGLSARASYGMGFRAPSFGERFLDFHNQVANYVVSGNADLQPEISRGWQAGLEWAPQELPRTKPFLPSVRVTFHDTRLAGLIQPRETAGSSMANQLFQYVNYNSAQIRGVEGALRVTSGERFIADVGYAWLDAWADFEGQKRGLPGRAGRQATANLVWAMPSVGLELGLRQQLLVMRSALEDDTKLPALYLADLRVAKRLWKAQQGPSEVQLYATCDNLANQTDSAFLQLPGRLFAAGLNARY